MFPRHCTTARTRVDSVRAAEADALTSLFNTNSDIAGMDPTFQSVDVDEVLGHIEESQRTEASPRGFRMQAIRLTPSDDLVGYLHFREATPKADVVGLTMFFIRPEFRSKGYGCEVADALLEHLSNDPMNRAAWAQVYLRNIPALRFWTGRGFSKVVEHKGQHIHVNGEHATVILERKLNPKAG